MTWYALSIINPACPVPHLVVSYGGIRRNMCISYDSATCICALYFNSIILFVFGVRATARHRAEKNCDSAVQTTPACALALVFLEQPRRHAHLQSHFGSICDFFICLGPSSRKFPHSFRFASQSFVAVPYRFWTPRATSARTSHCRSLWHGRGGICTSNS